MNTVVHEALTIEKTINSSKITALFFQMTRPYLIIQLRVVLFRFVNPELGLGWGMHVSTVVGNKGYDIEVIGKLRYLFDEIPTIQKVVNSLQIVN